MYKNLCEIVLQSNLLHGHLIITEGFISPRGKLFPFLKAMFTVYRIAFALALKPYAIGLLFTHKNGDFSAISVRKRSCAALISKIESHIGYNISSNNSLASINRLPR